MPIDRLAKIDVHDNEERPLAAVVDYELQDSVA